MTCGARTAERQEAIANSKGEGEKVAANAKARPKGPLTSAHKCANKNWLVAALPISSLSCIECCIVAYRGRKLYEATV